MCRRFSLQCVDSFQLKFQVDIAIETNLKALSLKWSRLYQKRSIEAGILWHLREDVNTQGRDGGIMIDVISFNKLTSWMDASLILSRPWIRILKLDWCGLSHFYGSNAPQFNFIVGTTEREEGHLRTKLRVARGVLPLLNGVMKYFGCRWNKE